MSSAREHLEQVAYFQLVDLHLHLHPELVLFFAIPNGGARHPAVAGKLKAEGVKPGVPDVMGAVPRDPFAGLFLEFKIRPNGPTRPQRRWHEELRAQGYRVEVVYSSVEAWEVTVDYLGLAYLRRHRPRPSPRPVTQR